MAKGKLKTIFVKMMSEAGTGFFYVTRKNPKNTPERLVLRKVGPASSHCPIPSIFTPAHRTPLPFVRSISLSFSPSFSPSHPPRPSLPDLFVSVSHQLIIATCLRRSKLAHHHPPPLPAHISTTPGFASTCSSQRPRSSSETSFKPDTLPVTEAAVRMKKDAPGP